MERKNKIIYILTIVCIIAFALMQAYWLYSRYIFTLDTQSSDIYSQVNNAFEIDLKDRSAHPDSSLYVVTSLRASTLDQNDSVKNKVWECVISLYKSQYRIQSDSVQPLILQNDNRIALEQKLIFKISNPPSENEMYDAIRTLTTNLRNPFKKDNFVRALNHKGLKVVEIKIEKVPNIIWSGGYTRKGSIFNPDVIISIPMDILNCNTMIITVKIPISPIIKDLAWTLILTLLISITLTACLIIQVITIKKQSRIAELRQNFIATMLHELKRPLFTLKMCISSLGFAKLDNEDAKMELLNQSRNEIDNLSTYFSKLRELSNNDVSGIPVNITRVNLAEIINHCIDKLHVPTEKTAKFTVKCEDSIVINGDRTYLADLFINLFENSVKYSDGIIRINIFVTEDKNCIKIQINDNGWGISKREQKRIFKRFFRGSRAINEELPGIGLGLAYVQQIVIAHQGRLYFSSTLGKGTSFEIIIPR